MKKMWASLKMGKMVKTVSAVVDTQHYSERATQLSLEGVASTEHNCVRGHYGVQGGKQSEFSTKKPTQKCVLFGEEILVPWEGLWPTVVLGSFARWAWSVDDSLRPHTTKVYNANPARQCSS